MKSFLIAALVACSTSVAADPWQATVRPVPRPKSALRMEAERLLAIEAQRYEVWKEMNAIRRRESQRQQCIDEANETRRPVEVWCRIVFERLEREDREDR